MALQFSAGSTRRRVLRLYYESMRVRTALFLAAASTCALHGQTTQGLITGTVRDSVTARPLAGVSVQAACFDPPDSAGSKHERKWNVLFSRPAAGNVQPDGKTD